MTAIPDDLPPLAEVVAEVQRTHGRVDVVRHGETIAVVMSPEYLESLEETIAVASDPELVAAIAEGEAELDAGLGIDAAEIEAEFLHH